MAICAPGRMRMHRTIATKGWFFTKEDESFTMSGMSTNSQAGAINTLLLPLLVALLLLVGVAVFGVWAFGSRQDYKDNVDAKITTAVTAAKAAEDKVKDTQFAEQDKNPLKTYTGPAAYGSVTINYPKTWSGYVSDSGNNDPFVDGYFSPGVVPDAQDEKSSFALRVQVSSQSYSETLQSFQNQDNSVTIQPYALPKVPNVVGVIVTGAIEQDRQGVMVILPLRNTTVKFWTESDAFKNDFSNIILPNASFAP